ncbi:MAG: hypothetical protein JKX85_07990 [Phycisphaeraceae bacterium]|nr:hypothetical protein [Phycisphaeraceae bacterium]
MSNTHQKNLIAGNLLIPTCGMNVFAHGPNPQENWESFELHLNRVASLAVTFATPFNAELFLYHLTIWHDLGKLSDAWQNYLKKAVLLKTIQMQTLWEKSITVRQVRNMR